MSITDTLLFVATQKRPTRLFVQKITLTAKKRYSLPIVEQADNSTYSQWQF
jgi:hypothetical protein